MNYQLELARYVMTQFRLNSFVIVLSFIMYSYYVPVVAFITIEIACILSFFQRDYVFFHVVSFSYVLDKVFIYEITECT